MVIELYFLRIILNRIRFILRLLSYYLYSELRWFSRKYFLRPTTRISFAHSRTYFKNKSMNFARMTFGSIWNQIALFLFINHLLSHDDLSRAVAFEKFVQNTSTLKKGFTFIGKLKTLLVYNSFKIRTPVNSMHLRLKITS